MASKKTYIGRFAPSPSGPLHMGSLVTALASYLDAKAHHGAWLLRIENVDQLRSREEFINKQLEQLNAYGLKHDGDIIIQSQRHQHYSKALTFLQTQGHAYPCTCSRQIWQSKAQRNSQQEWIYPGICRTNSPELLQHQEHAWRLKLPDQSSQFIDRQYGFQHQNLAAECGDFILRRRDRDWAYQLAVVVDDYAQGVTHIVRGADLLIQTHRQIYLQRCLGFNYISYLHIPLVLNDKGQKLSKQNLAKDISTTLVMPTLQEAWQHLNMPSIYARTPQDFLKQALPLWANRWAIID